MPEGVYGERRVLRLISNRGGLINPNRLYHAARAAIEHLERRRLFWADVPEIWVDSPVSANEEGQQPGSFLFHRYDSCAGDPGNFDAVVQFRVDLNASNAATPGYDTSYPGTDYRVEVPTGLTPPPATARSQSARSSSTSH